MGAKKWLSKDTGEELTIKEEQFVRLYVFGTDGEAGNASECYRKVYGQTENQKNDTIWVYACKLMKNPRVKESIRKLSEDDLTEESILREIRAISRDKSNKAADRVRAMELLGKSKGIFIDKSEVSVKTDLIFSDEEQK